MDIISFNSLNYWRNVAMELLFQQQQFNFEHTPASDEVIEKINELLKESYYFSHFIADGTEVYEDHENYLIVNIGRIEKLEVIAKTEKEFINDVLLSAQEYLKRAKPELATLPEGFYANPTADTYASFEQLLGGLQWLDEMLSIVGSSNERPKGWEQYMGLSETMKSEIANLGEAVENSDNVLVADIIQYELISIFEELELAIGTTIDTVGTRYDFS